MSYFQPLPTGRPFSGRYLSLEESTPLASGTYLILRLADWMSTSAPCWLSNFVCLSRSHAIRCRKLDEPLRTANKIWKIWKSVSWALLRRVTPWKKARRILTRRNVLLYSLDGSSTLDHFPGGHFLFLYQTFISSRRPVKSRQISESFLDFTGLRGKSKVGEEKNCGYRRDPRVCWICLNEHLTAFQVVEIRLALFVGVKRVGSIKKTVSPIFFVCHRKRPHHG